MHEIYTAPHHGYLGSPATPGCAGEVSIRLNRPRPYEAIQDLIERQHLAGEYQKFAHPTHENAPIAPQNP